MRTAPRATPVSEPPVALTDQRLPGESAKTPERPGRFRILAATVWPPGVVFFVTLAIWLLMSYTLLSEQQRFLLPPPQQVIELGFLRWENLKEILQGLWSTTQVALTGLAIAIGLGMAFAISMSQAKWVERSFYPYAVALQTIPIIALVPLIGFWFSFNFKSRVIACVIISIFPIITNTLFGIHSVEGTLHDLFTLHGAKRSTRLWKLQLPWALPAIFTGFRISAGLSVIGAIVGDFFFRQGEPGIGRLIDIYRNQLQSEQLFSAIFFSSLLGIVVFWAFGVVGYRLIRSWHDSALRP